MTQSILLYNPLSLRDIRQKSYINFGLEIVKQIAEQQGYKADTIQFHGIRKGFSGHTQPIHTYDIIAVSLTHHLQTLNLLPLLSQTHSKQTRVIGGPATHHPTAYQELFHTIYQGDAEDKLPQLLQIQKGDPIPAQLTGRIRKLQTPTITHNKIAHIEISRGCKYKCKFCYITHNYKRYLEKNYLQVKDQINTAASQGIKKIKFLADEFFLHHKAKEIMQYTIDNNLQIINSNYRLDSILKHHDLIQEANPKSINTGIESYTQEALTACSKGFNTDDIQQAIQQIIPNHHRLHFYLIYNLPYSNNNDLLTFMKVAENIRKHTTRKNIINYSITTFEPSKGTPYADIPPTQHNLDWIERKQFDKQAQKIGTIWGHSSKERYLTGLKIQHAKKPMTQQLHNVWKKRYTLQQGFNKKIWPTIQETG